jgi:ATP-binding cassette subfamily B (MDR/TAP) protein 1
MPIIALGGMMQSKFLKGQADESGGTSAAGAAVSEAIASIRTVAAFQLEERAVKSFQTALSAPLRLSVRRSFTSGFFTGFSAFVLNSANGVIFYIGMKWILAGKLTFQSLIQCVMAMMFM